VLTSSFDLDDPFDVFEEKSSSNTKRVCVTFAVIALAIGGLDFMNIRPLDTAAAFVHAHFNGGVESAIDTSSSVTVAVPREVLAHFAAAAAKDAIEVAMVAPPNLKPATLDDIAQHAEEMAKKMRDATHAEAMPEPTPPAATMQLASLTQDVLPEMESDAPMGTISLPDTIAVLPPPAPGAPPPSPAERLHLVGKERAHAERCLANAIYFEARDQPHQGQVAVAQVVMNRVFSGVYPRDVCGVIYQNSERHLACQFTLACNGKRKVINERAAWARAKRIARETLDGVLYVPEVGTATHYHATYVRPNWVREMHRLAREGTHLFYRPIAWGSGADEPIWSRQQKAAMSSPQKIAIKQVAANGKIRQLAANSKKR
jgi:hypothetical protein